MQIVSTFGPKCKFEAVRYKMWWIVTIVATKWAHSRFNLSNCIDGVISQDVIITKIINFERNAYIWFFFYARKHNLHYTVPCISIGNKWHEYQWNSKRAREKESARGSFNCMGGLFFFFTSVIRSSAFQYNGHDTTEHAHIVRYTLLSLVSLSHWIRMFDLDLVKLPKAGLHTKLRT